MKKRTHVFAVIFAVIILSCSMINGVSALDTVIDDRSGFLFPSENEECLGVMQEISAKYNINVHVVTDDFYDGTDDEAGKDFAYEYYNGIYDGVENGVILAIDNIGGSGNRYVYILASGTCSEHIDEYDIDDITLELQNYIVDDDIKGCIMYFLNSVDDYMSIEPSTDDYGGGDYYDGSSNDSSYNNVTFKANIGRIILFGVIGGIVIAVIAVVIVKRGYKKFGVVNGIDANAVTSINLTASTDNVINRVVTMRHIPKDPPPESHSDGGGHSSGFSGGSSSDGFSGGGRGF